MITMQLGKKGRKERRERRELDRRTLVSESRRHSDP